VVCNNIPPNVVKTLLATLGLSWTPPKTRFRRLIEGLLAIGQCGGDGTVDWDGGFRGGGLFDLPASALRWLQRAHFARLERFPIRRHHIRQQ